MTDTKPPLTDEQRRELVRRGHYCSFSDGPTTECKEFHSDCTWCCED